MLPPFSVSSIEKFVAKEIKLLSSRTLRCPFWMNDEYTEDGGIDIAMAVDRRWRTITQEAIGLELLSYRVDEMWNCGVLELLS
jgi:hypothetical protein